MPKRKLRIDLVAEFVVSTMIETDLTLEEFAALPKEQREELVYGEAAESWYQMCYKFRDANLRQLEAYELDENMDDVRGPVSLEEKLAE